MTNDAPPPVYPPRKKLSFEQERPRGNAVRQGMLLIYGLLAAGLAGLAVYNSMQHLPLAYVAAPGIGAAWFALRVFMMLNSRKSD